MKILHIVTLVAPDNPFGGPVRVALNHARALRDGGHEVQVIAGARDYSGPLPSIFDGEPVRLFRTRTLSRQLGFSGMLAPSMLRWLLRNVRSFDVVHIHLARDLVTLPPAALCSITNRPYIVQAHGMIDGSTKRLARLLDVLITRRVLRTATALLFLTQTEREGLTALVPGLKNLAPISNGVPLPGPRRVPEARASSKVEVLFLARLHPRKRPLLFAQAAQEIARSHPGVAFRLVGPDEGEAADLQRILAAQPDLDISWEGPLAPEATSDRLAQADVYVLPSVDEPFPMSVLEAMALGLPVVVTDSCGLAPAIAENAAGIVASETLLSLTEAITDLLDDPAKRISMGKQAAELVHQQFTDTEVAKHLQLIYEDAVSSARAGNAA